jgi:5-(carboxyamino)imidazole ribonucleotide mutase
MKKDQTPIALAMGSTSDWPTLEEAYHTCREFGVDCDVRVLSAHRLPADMANYARNAHRRGVRVIIAAAGGAAHLPGMIASHSPLPVIGVPVESKTLRGVDSLLSIVQMPSGVPVATVAIGGAKNAALLALQILGVSDPEMQKKIVAFKQRLARETRSKGAALRRTLGKR